MNLSQTRQNLTKFDHTFSFLFVTSVQTRTHKSKDKLTSPHTNLQDNFGFDLAKYAAQLLYGSVLVFFIFVLFFLSCSEGDQDYDQPARRKDRGQHSRVFHRK